MKVGQDAKFIFQDNIHQLCQEDAISTIHHEGGGAQSSLERVAYQSLTMPNYVSLEHLKATFPAKGPQRISAHLAFQLQLIKDLSYSPLCRFP